MEGVNQAWTTYPDCEHVPNCDERLTRNGHPYYPIPEIRPGDQIPGLQATTSPSPAQPRQPGPFPLLNPCQAKNNILHERHLPLVHISPYLRNEFDTRLAESRLATSIVKDGTPSAQKSYDLNTEHREHTHPSLLNPPDINLNDPESAVTAYDNSATSTSPYDRISSCASRSGSDFHKVSTPPATPSPQSGHGSMIPGTPKTAPDPSNHDYTGDEHPTLTSPEPALKSKLVPSSAGMRMMLQPQARSADVSTPSTPSSESDFIVVGRPTLSTPETESRSTVVVGQPDSPSPGSTTLPGQVMDLAQRLARFGMGAATPITSVDTANPQSAESQSDFELIHRPPSTPLSPTPATARLTSRNLFLSDLAEGGFRLPSSSVVNVELHMSVSPDTFAYEPASMDDWES